MLRNAGRRIVQRQLHAMIGEVARQVGAHHAKPHQAKRGHDSLICIEPTDMLFILLAAPKSGP